MAKTQDVAHGANTYEIVHETDCSEQSQAGAVGRGDQSHTLTRYQR